MKEIKKPKVLMAVGNELAFDGRVQRAADALSDNFDITIIGYSSNSAYRQKNCQIVEIKMPKFKIFTGIKKTLVPFFHLYFFIKILMLFIKIKPDIFYGHDFFMALPGYILSKVFNVFFVYDAHELIIPNEQFEQSLELKVWYFLEKLAVKQANLIIAANEERAKKMQEHYKLKEQPLHFRNLSPLKTEKTVFTIPTQLKNKQTGEIWIIYQGVVDFTRGLLYFIDAIKYLDDRFKLIIVGYGKDFNTMMEYVKESNLNEKVIFINKVPRNVLHDVIRLCDIGIVAYANLSLNEVYCEPNKLYDYANVGLPLIVTNQINLVKILNKYKIGKIVGFEQDKKNYPKEIADAILEIVANYNFFKHNINDFLNEYNWINEKNRLNQKLSEIYYDKLKLEFK